MTEDPSKPHVYIVELTLEMPEAAFQEALARWDWLFSQLSNVASGPLWLQAMPSISAPEPGVALLRWVGVAGNDPDDAVAQARSQLAFLAAFLPGLAAHVLDGRAYPDS